MVIDRDAKVELRNLTVAQSALQLPLILLCGIGGYFQGLRVAHAVAVDLERNSVTMERDLLSTVESPSVAGFFRYRDAATVPVLIVCRPSGSNTVGKR
jgi:hypothetical protein